MLLHERSHPSSVLYRGEVAKCPLLRDRDCICRPVCYDLSSTRAGQSTWACSRINWDKLTCSNQANACSGRLYFWQCSFKSLTSVGNTVSNSLRLVGILALRLYNKLCNLLLIFQPTAQKFADIKLELWRESIGFIRRCTRRCLDRIKSCEFHQSFDGLKAPAAGRRAWSMVELNNRVSILDF